MPSHEATRIGKEVYRLVVFSHLTDLWLVFGDGQPAGVHVLGQLFSLLRDGKPEPGLRPEAFEYRLDPSRRRGTLAFGKSAPDGGPASQYFVSWEVKHVEVDHGVATATILVRVDAGDPQASARHLDGVVANMDMPVQRLVSEALVQQPAVGTGFRVFTVHHRTGEVAATLATLREHGFAIDTYIGIPYGEASWHAARMLDHASGGRYLCLRSTEHPVRPTEWSFDFAQSSFVDEAETAAIEALFARDDRAIDYLTGMNRLVEHRLATALETCFARGERLVIYEDGGYAVPLLYAIHRDPSHPLHARVRRAVDERVVVGAVEVTTAGERRALDLVRHPDDVAILPVLSCAREEIKQVFEGRGVSIAVINAAATALGNLGLPTFAVRRVAVLGGNGAIGVRVIEEVALRHNSTANLFAVDLAATAFRRDLDRVRFPHAATRVAYRPLPRHSPDPGARVEIVDQPLSSPDAVPDLAALGRAIDAALEDAAAPDFARTGSYAARLAAEIGDLVETTAVARGWDHHPPDDLPGGAGRAWELTRGDERRRISLLAHGTVLTYPDLTSTLRAGVDTVIGATGREAFGEADLDTFLDRAPGGDRAADSLVLISASSKDYEFKPAIRVLGRLVRLQEGAATTDEAIAWLRALYEGGRTFVATPETTGDTAGDTTAIAGLLAADSDDSLGAALAARPDVASALGLDDVPREGLRAALAAVLTARLRSVITLRKETWPDVGLVYRITYRGRRKDLVLLANGYAINFFARYEKGVKTEYIDPIVTMQLLGVVRLTGPAVPPGVHAASAHLDAEDVARLWDGLEACCRPLRLGSSD